MCHFVDFIWLHDVPHIHEVHVHQRSPRPCENCAASSSSPPLAVLLVTLSAAHLSPASSKPQHPIPSLHPILSLPLGALFLPCLVMGTTESTSQADDAGVRTSPGAELAASMAAAAAAAAKNAGANATTAPPVASVVPSVADVPPDAKLVDQWVACMHRWGVPMSLDSILRVAVLLARTEDLFPEVFLSASCSLFTRDSLAASFTAGLQEANGGVPVSEVTKCRVRAVFDCALAARAKRID